MVSGLLRYRPLLWLLTLLMWTIAFCVPIVTGLVNQSIFDQLQDNAGDRSPLVALFGVLLVIALVRPVLFVTWGWLHITVEMMTESLVRTNFFDWALARVGRRGTPPSPAKLVGHMRDDVPGHTDVINEWYRLSGEGMFVVLALIIMVGIDPVVTALTFLPLAAVVVFTHWMRSQLPELWGEAREATTRVTGFIADVFGGVQAIKVAGAERAVVRRFHDINDERRQAEIRALVADRRIDAVSDAIVVVGQGLVLLVAAGAMLKGRFTVGDFMLFTIYLDWMLMLPRRVARLLSQRKESGKALQRLGETMDGTPVTSLVEHRTVHLTTPLPPMAAPDADAPADPLTELTVRDLSYRYPNSSHGIDGIGFRLPGGTVTVVTGEVGSGKSTMLEVLLGLRTPDGGEISWNGRPIDDLGEFMTPPRVAYKPQVPRLFSESLRDNVLLGLPADDKRLNDAVHRAALDEDLTAFTDGLSTMVGPRGVRLSGGQVQRTSAARMLVRAPQLCVVDDLSSALDDETERTIWERLDASRTRDTTYLVVSHRPAALRRADQVLVLRAGRVADAGTLAELVERSPEVRRILDLPVAS